MINNKIKNQRIVFILPKDATVTDTINEILINNGLKETTEEFLDKEKKGIEPRLIIVRDAARTIVQKRIPEKKLIELLEKHLEIKKHAAENIVKEIKEKLIPYAKIIDEEKEAKIREQEREAERQKEELEEKNRKQKEEKRMQEEEIEEERKEEFRKAKEELLEKIRANQNIPEPEPEPAIEMPYDKKPEITDVDKNAENMEKMGQNVITKSKELPVDKPTEKPQAEEKKVDPYKEPIE